MIIYTCKLTSYPFVIKELYNRLLRESEIYQSTITQPIIEIFYEDQKGLHWEKVEEFTYFSFYRNGLITFILDNDEKFCEFKEWFLKIFNMDIYDRLTEEIIETFFKKHNV